MFKTEKKCIHNKRLRNCVECGGSGICIHKKRRSTCIECEGSEICMHERRRQSCIECNGSSICEHKRQRRNCKICTDPIHIIIREWITHSRKSDIKFNRYNEQAFITYNFCQKLIQESHNQCYYCSIPLQMLIRQNDMITIERINNAIGHIIGNCRIACYHCNCSRVGQRI